MQSFKLIDPSDGLVTRSGPASPLARLRMPGFCEGPGLFTLQKGFFSLTFPILLPGKDFRNFSMSVHGAVENIFIPGLTNSRGLWEPGKEC